MTKLPPTDGCPGPAGVVATLLEQVLGSGPIIGDFDGEPDTLRLTSGDDFVAFRRLPDEPVVTRLRQVPVTGTVQGEPWQLIVVPAGPAGSDAMCLEVRLARGALKSCSDWEEVIAASAYDLLGDRVIAGSTTPDVASARVRFADDTEPMVIPTVVADDYDRRFFAATITSDAPIAEVMALDAAGNDLEPVADLGGGVLETGN